MEGNLVEEREKLNKRPILEGRLYEFVGSVSDHRIFDKV